MALLGLVLVVLSLAPNGAERGDAQSRAAHDGAVAFRAERVRAPSRHAMVAQPETSRVAVENARRSHRPNGTRAQSMLALVLDATHWLDASARTMRWASPGVEWRDRRARFLRPGGRVPRMDAGEHPIA